MGDLLFAVVNYARHLGVQPELALDRSAKRFVQRFSQMERLVVSEGAQLTDFSLDQLDQRWEQAKQEEAKNETR